jgi:hypothetical protein
MRVIGSFTLLYTREICHVSLVQNPGYFLKNTVADCFKWGREGVRGREDGE